MPDVSFTNLLVISVIAVLAPVQVCAASGRSRSLASRGGASR